MRAGRLKSEKSREQQYKKAYTIAIENKIVEWDEVSNVEQMWDQVKQAEVDRVKEMDDCKGEKKEPKMRGVQ